MSTDIQSIIQQYNIVIFDTECVLCHGWAKFLIQFDQDAQFKLVAAQSSLGHALHLHYDMPTENFTTMVVIHNQTLYTKSSAFLKVMHTLGFPFSATKIGYMIPQFARDTLYQIIANNRYKIFGKSERCIVPTLKNKNHFLIEEIHEK